MTGFGTIWGMGSRIGRWRCHGLPLAALMLLAPVLHAEDGEDGGIRTLHPYGG